MKNYFRASLKKKHFFAVFALLATTLALGTGTRAKETRISLAESQERGVFNIGAAQGETRPLFDQGLKRNVLEFDFNASPNAVVGVWTRGYPGVDSGSADTVRIGLRSDAEQLPITVEIKGGRGVQKIPAQTRPGTWMFSEAKLDWEKIGELKEVVFVAGPIQQTSTGTLHLDLVFSKAARRTGSFGIMDAEERGAFTMGASKGDIRPFFDNTLGKDILEFAYKAPQGSAVGIWTKGYPAGLGRASANTARIRVRVPEPTQVRQVSVLVELKGTRVTQSIPVPLQAGSNTVESRIDWDKIGGLKEVVFVVSPLGGGEPATGTLYLDADFVMLTAAPATPAAEETFSLLSARERGVFNMGASKGDVAAFFDKTLGKNVLKFAYRAPKGTAIGVWTKNYPSVLGPATANAAGVDIRLPTPNQETEIATTLEIKGTRVTQSIPLQLKSGSNSFRELINWDVIGDLREVVFVVNPLEGFREASGTLYFNVEFLKISALPETKKEPAKTSPLGGKVLLLLAVSLLLTGTTALFRKLTRKKSTDEIPGQRVETLGASWKRDILYGMVAVIIAGATLNIFVSGPQTAGGPDLGFLVVALAGAVAAELLKFGLTRKHLTTLEICQNILFSGFLAATASSQTLWQAPTNWIELLQKSSLTVSLAFLIYHATNACLLVSSGRHLGMAAGALIVGVPYLFGWLLTLQNAGLLQSLSNLLTAGSLSSWPSILDGIGRFVVVVAFNEAVTQGISWVTKGRSLRTPRAHLLIAMVSLAVVLAPSIADLGSGDAMAGLPVALQAVAAVLTAMLSQAGLWMEVYLITGMILDGVYGGAPSWKSVSGHATIGLGKGMVYSGIFMAILYFLKLLFGTTLFQSSAAGAPAMTGLILGALIFPFAKAIIESFDGSQAFLERVRYSYRKGHLYARGAVAGFGFAYGLAGGLVGKTTPDRMIFGLLVGLLASTGVSIVRDAFYSARNRGRLQCWRLYFIDALLGGFIGAALAFYMDASQVPTVVEKFKLYTSSGFEPKDFTIYALLSKWGRVDLGSLSGGVKLLFNEALAGVITWAIAAWLFAVNRTFLAAYFQKDKAPITHFFSKAGFVDLSVNMIHVLRWGLWMSPIINTGLRMMGEATWYNQDGAVRTLLAIYHNFTLGPQEFQEWSLQVFIALLASDLVRVLIWIDHMGLRVATLVNLSFMGLDKLDEKIARFLRPAATQRYIPEGVKRFTTWAPLLIPFYIPRGPAWDYAWDTSQKILNAPREPGTFAAIQAMPVVQLAAYGVLAAIAFASLSFVIRNLRRWSARRRQRTFELSNREYRVTVRENGETFSEVTQRGHDVTRRAYDPMHPCGRALFLVDAYEGAGSPGRAWPIIGNCPKNLFDAPELGQTESSIRAVSTRHGIRSTLDIRLCDQDSPAELCSITVENLTDKPRDIKVVPYLEWVLDRPDADRGHTQYNRLFPEMEYLTDVNAVIAWSKHSKSTGFLAANVPPVGFLTSRMDFVGRAQSLWHPRALQTLGFLQARDTAPYPTFDPIASVLIPISLRANSSQTVAFLIGATRTRDTALETIRKHLMKREADRTGAKETVGKSPTSEKKRTPLIGHGEILPGTPQPYSKFIDNGNRLLVLTPYTPRPYDHAMSNALGHYVMVTNRGLHTSANGNSQQNPVTPDWPDTVTREVPAEAIYLYDPDTKEWFSPTLHPVNNHAAKHEAEFAVDGTAIFRMEHAKLSTELTVFVPPDEPLGVYMLTIKNASDRPRQLRVTPYFQIVLTSLAERRHGPLSVKPDQSQGAVFFENPRNAFRPGVAFASVSSPVERVETKRSRFFGAEQGTSRPSFVEKGLPAEATGSEDKPIAAFLTTVEVPAHGEKTVVVTLGQTDDREKAESLIQKYKDAETARESLASTRKWWLDLMGTVHATTNHPDFDEFQNWLKYQGVAERLWGRRGFYQTSGAYGFRDQLQDSVNLVWVDPAMARKQLILHASQQFLEGDVVHWFHTLYDGRTAFANRSHASDNLLWLAWGVAEYVNAVGDYSVLDEKTSYLESENPFLPLPKNKHGWGAIYLRSTREDSVYRHCMKAIDLVLEKRMGARGIPLIGTGDWNDGLDEIGSRGKGESVWLGFFLYYILKNMLGIIERKDGGARKKYYAARMKSLADALEKTWRDDRYLRAIHDDGTEIGLKDSGVWEIDALTAAWAVMSGINFERGVTVFETALRVLEKENVILLGWPALREDTKPYLGRSSHYPEGVRENGMYCHGEQWLVKAARVLAEEFEKRGDEARSSVYRSATYRLWRKIAPVSHVTSGEIELYGGQPNKQAADMLTTFDQGRMIWHGYTGAAGWMLRQAYEGVIGASLQSNEVVLPSDLDRPRGDLKINGIQRDLRKSPFQTPANNEPAA